MSIDLQCSQKQIFKLNVCRLCSHIRDKVLPIFDNAGSKVDVKIRECFPYLNIRKDDSKPQHICIDCITKLNMFNEFLQVCVESECKFDNYLKQYVEQETMLVPSLIPSNIGTSSVWQDELIKNTETQSFQNKNDVIFLSKMDANNQNQSVQNIVVMVELKYQDRKGEENSNKISNSILHELSPSALNDASPNSNDTKSNANDINLEEYNDSIMSNLDNSQSPEKLPKEKKIFPCPACSRTFSRKTRLNAHMVCHVTMKPHKCDKCDKAFSMRSDLNIHKRVHTNEYKCQFCQKSFASKSKLERHLRIHTKERPFSCSECGKSFGDKRNLVNHIRAHVGLKPHSCTLCGKSFGVRSHLKAHLGVHSNTPRFNCTLCEKSFKWKANLNKHMKTHTTEPSPK